MTNKKHNNRPNTVFRKKNLATGEGGGEGGVWEIGGDGGIVLVIAMSC
jgi:hypothetical protein